MIWRSLLFALATVFAWAEEPYPALTDDESNTIEVYQKSKDAVVFVSNRSLRRDPFSRRIYERQAGSGTGFFWDDDGHIITNYHVIDGANEVTIRMQNGIEKTAELIGIAPERDLAVLKIDLDNLTPNPLILGDSERLVVGHKVLAIGNPFGLDTTLTTGVISALSRTIESPANRTIRDVIQTDAAINPGNSGGPLLNSAGELIGINTAIYSPSGASAGIGFSIPVNTLKTTIPELIEFGQIQRPTLGIELAPRQLARRLQIDGLAIAKVTRGYGADRAGIKGLKIDRDGRLIIGDILVAIDGVPMTSSDDLLTILEDRNYGDTLVLSIFRDGKNLEVEVLLTTPQDLTI